MKRSNQENDDTNTSNQQAFSDTVYNIVLVPNVAQTINVPTTSPRIPLTAVFFATNSIYVNFNGGTAVVPSVNITDGTGSVLNPSAKFLGNLQSFSIISPVATIVSIEWFA